MKLLKNSLLTLVMVYSFVSGQVTAMEYGESGSSSQTKKRSTSVQNEGLTFKQQAIKFYARNYGVVNFTTVVVPMTACSIYGMISLVDYVQDLQQQQTAENEKFRQQLVAQRERYESTCMVAAKECNGSWFPWGDICYDNLAQSTCVSVLFDCVSRLCGWDLLFVPNNDTRSSQLLVNAHINVCSK